ncbi:MAG: carbohydrate porin [Beijerinckiaceae bacterium]
MQRILLSVATLAALAAAPAVAADLEPMAPSPTNTWGGFYLGGHAGYAFATSNWTSDIGTPASGTVSLPSSDKQFGPIAAGYQFGYNYILSGGFLLGFETDLSFPDIMGSTLSLADPGGPTRISDNIQIYGSARGRVGYTFDNWLVYGTGGFAYDRDRINDDVGDEVFFWRTGWTAGLGTEVRLTPNWSAKLEYSYYDFARTGIILPSTGQHYNSDLSLQMLQLGLNYRPGNSTGDPVLGGGIVSDLDKWSLHAQTTLIGQGYLPFPALYSGAQSLHPGGDARDTWSVTGYFGYKPWEGTEIYYNPEPFQGFGLATTHGLGDFPNFEAQKAGFDYPHMNSARAFVRQTFGLGGEQEDLEDGQNQVASKVDVSRVTVTAGKMAVPDIFDNNSYAHDPRVGFMNWGINDGALDYAADEKGYTWGIAAELNQKDWAIRTGYFLEPDVPNGNNFDTRLGERGQYLAELEERYSLFSQPGKLRVLGWLAECYCGSFSATMANPLLNPLTAPAGSPGIAGTRQTRSEYGFTINLEQAITKDFGIFSRVSWQDGQTEIMAWTDIDESASVGGVLKGTSWGRPDDTIGVAGVISGLSSSYVAYLAAGGLGINIGDGAINYRPEQVLETYYNYHLTKWATLTLDYQFVANPAYNADRGPVHIGSVRVHAEF